MSEEKKKFYDFYGNMTYTEPEKYRDFKGNLILLDFEGPEVSPMGWGPTLTWGMFKYSAQMEDMYLVGVAWLRESNGEYFYYRYKAPSLAVGVQVLTWILLDVDNARQKAEQENDEFMKAFEGVENA